VAGYKRTSSNLGPFLTFLERELQRRVKDYRPVLDYCGFSVVDDAEPSIVDLVERVIATIVAENKDRQISMDKIVRLVRTHNGLPLPLEKPTWDVRQGMFRLLGRITMLYEIPESPSHEHLKLLKPLDPPVIFDEKPIDEAGAPVGQLMAGFGEFVPAMKRKERFDLEAWPPKQPEPVYLDTNVLNFSTLTKVAKINVVWSNLMSEHLMFDRPLRRLTLFNFPTFCALNYGPIEKKTVFSHIMNHPDFPKPDVGAAHRSMFRETLLSYRVIFGQHHKSRKLFKEQEQGRASAEGVVDVLLVDLCSSLRSFPDIVVDGSIDEQPFYDSNLDFPFYGERLEALQQYTRAVKARNLKEVWYDEREPEKWAVLWVAIMIGGASISLSLVQVILAAFQVAFAVPHR
ncbi:MAG: hypothetical protein Q9224_006956, partial [Gallowayella concinna]